MLGVYLCLSTWLAVLIFCAFYYILGIESWRISLLFITSLGGLVSAYLFFKEHNALAVLINCVAMHIAVVICLFFPKVGSVLNYSLVLVAIVPIVLLKRMHYGIVFINLAACLIVLSLSELIPSTTVPVIEEVFVYLLKFTIMIFVFFHVYALRVVMDRQRSSQAK